MIPLDIASWLGGAILALGGPLLASHRTAKRNLAKVFPQMTAKQHQQIAGEMWWHFGRAMAEFCHLDKHHLLARVTVEGLEHMPKDGQPAMLISGHYGMWELSYAMLHSLGYPVSIAYRPANNPIADAMIQRLRLTRCNDAIPKGTKTVAALMRAMKAKQHLAFLIDQKARDGISVPFFGFPAYTSPFAADIALRYHYPVIPVRVVRTKGAHFHMIIEPPVALPNLSDKEEARKEGMLCLNAVLERWITEHPEQWFWMHRRWIW